MNSNILPSVEKLIHINFGILGIVVFAIILGIVVSHLDFNYWHTYVKQKKSFLYYYYPASLGLFFFIMRGDLMSSFTYTVGIYVIFKIIHKIIYSSPYENPN